jgi:hypothetical protein
MPGGRREVSIGFSGGQVLSVRLDDHTIEGLGRAIGGAGWHELQTEEGTARVRLDDVVYVRVERDEHRVGFG